MSVKAQGLVWDLKCPDTINGVAFNPNHKYVLIAYADHADHNGKNIWPAIKTIHEKTGLYERTVQRLTRELQTMGLLVEIGKGPRGTNKWALPFSDSGDRLLPRGVTVTPVAVPGVKGEKSLGVNPLGVNPLGVTVTPELKELNQETIKYISNDVFDSWEKLKAKIQPDFRKAQFETWIEPTEAVSFDDMTLNVMVSNSFACSWLEENVTALAQTHLGVYVKFVVAETWNERMGLAEVE